MKIDDKDVGPSQSPFFIAEAGVNHNGEIELAKELVDVAAKAGADAVKFQTFSADRLVTPDASKVEYQTETTGEGSQYDMLKRYELDQEAHEILFDYCRQQNITFLSTPFDCESASMLEDLGVTAFKLGSGELDNLPLIKHVAEFGLPMMVSTGMGTLEEVVQASEAIRSVDPNPDVVFLHCTSTYPCSIEDVHLRAMQTMENELTAPVGYSDHTKFPETPGLAVIAGACVLEKHFTIDRSLPGPDHKASLEPDELADAVDFTETANRALGSAEKRPTAAELNTLDKSRKGLYAAVDIPAGSKIRDEHVDVLRPAMGLSPRKYNEVIGSRAQIDFAAGDPITAPVVEGIKEGEE
jgi:N-acetylneuraminate synthase/N,N'-diacetyllegionaminate synthase